MMSTAIQVLERKAIKLALLLSESFEQYLREPETAENISSLYPIGVCSAKNSADYSTTFNAMSSEYSS